MVIYAKVKLGALGKIVTGKTPPTNNPNNYGDDYMFIGPTDLNKHFIINQSEKRISIQGLQSIKGSIINGLSVLVGCIGWDMGNVGLVEATCATNQQINAITEFNPDINPYYVYYWLKNKKQFLFQKASVTRTPILNKTDFSNLEMAIPNRHYQDKVVEFLSAIDRKIELNNRINAELEAMAKTIYDYWFVQFDFPISKEQAKAMGKPKLEGKPYKASGGKMVWSAELKREIPEGWEATNVLKIAALLGGGTPKTSITSYWNGNIPFFTPSDATIGIFALDTNKKVTKEGLDSCSSALYKQGTVFLTARGTVGKVNVAGRDMAMNQSCYALAPKDGINSAFLHQCTLHLVHFLQAKGNGSVFDSIVSNDIKLTSISIPPRNLIRQFGELVIPFYEKILVGSLENKSLAQLRDWLLPMLMNGQVRIKETTQTKLATPVVSESKPVNSYFYQTQLVAAIVNASKKHKITHGEMTLAKYTYLVDKLYGVPSHFNFRRWHLGPYPPEMKKVVNNKKFFKIQNNEVSVVPQEKKYNYQFQKQVEEAVVDLASIFNQYKGKERAHQTELLATVCKVVEDIRSTDLKAVRESMREWPIDLKGVKFKNKAAKFGEDETAACLHHIVTNGWNYNLLDE